MQHSPKMGCARRQSPAAATSSTLHKPAQAASGPLAVSPRVADGCIEARTIRPRPGQAPSLRVNEGTGGSPRLPREGACSWLQPSSCSLAAAACCLWSSAGQQRRRCCTPRWIDSSWICYRGATARGAPQPYGASHDVPCCGGGARCDPTALGPVMLQPWVLLITRRVMVQIPPSFRSSKKPGLSAGREKLGHTIKAPSYHRGAGKGSTRPNKKAS